MMVSKSFFCFSYSELDDEEIPGNNKIFIYSFMETFFLTVPWFHFPDDPF